MFNAECHCGNISLVADEAPETITSCNCSICNRLGALWGYYSSEHVKITLGDKPEDTYQWGDKAITFHRCSECGCTTRYSSTSTPGEGSTLIAINCRMAPLSAIKNIPQRQFDGLDTWSFVNE